ncbi:hypothetical protein MRX96_034847 [Rhipicephalus microplus]
MSRLNLILTALLVSSTSAVLVTTAMLVRNPQWPEPLPSLLHMRPPRQNPWQVRHLPLYFECQSSACRAIAEDPRKSIAWSLDPCTDFYEYVCSGDRAKTNGYDHAVARYLREVHGSDRIDLPSWRSQLEDVWKYMELSGNLGTIESMLTTFSRVLEIFPVVHVDVLGASRKTCIVLSRPEGNGADRIFIVPCVLPKFRVRGSSEILRWTF